MPNKRKLEEREKKMKKIRKLEKKIKKYRDDMSLSSDPELLSERDSDCYDSTTEAVNVEEALETPTIETTEVEEVVETPTLSSQDNLPSEILEALGEVAESSVEYASEIKPELVKIFENILTDGLTKEHRENILKNCKIPCNTKLLDAPKLNLEFLGLLNKSTSTRDNLLKERQQDLGHGTALMCQAIDELTNTDFNKIEVIKKLSNSIRILSNLHHQYTVIRRKLITPTLDKSLTQNLNENKRSEFLYSKLEDTVKTTTAMKRTMNILKPKNQPKNYPRRQNTNLQSHPPRPNQANRRTSGPYNKTRNTTQPQAKTLNRRPFQSNRGGRTNSKYP